MALPKIDKPLFIDKLPSTGEEIYYRPFTVKEEKILLFGQQTKNIDQAVLAMKQVINSCTSYKSGKEFDVGNLPVFDLEYILLKMRSKAVDNTIPLVINDEETKEQIKINLDLDSVEVKRYEDHTNKIKINDEYVLIMRYPSVDMLPAYANEEISETERSFNMMVQCMDKLVSEDDVYNFTEETVESIIEFLDDLDPQTLFDIKKFFETSPRMRHEIKYKNSLGNEKIVVIEGTESFFK